MDKAFTVSEETTAMLSAEVPKSQAQRQAHGEAELAGNPAAQSENLSAGNRPSEALAKAIAQAQFLIAYVAKQGNIFDPALLNTLIRSKQLFDSGRFTIAEEVAFWLAYNELVKALKPVSIESLEESLPPPGSGKKWFGGFRQAPSAANRMVRRYRLLSAFSLVLILAAQVYWLIGSGVTGELEKIFAQREHADTELTQYRYEKELRADQADKAGDPSAMVQAKAEQDPTLLRLQKDYNFSNQLLNSHYGLLQKWNRVWEAMLFMEPFQGESTAYKTLEFETRQGRLREQLDRIKQRAVKKGGVVDATADVSAEDNIAQQLAQGNLSFEHDKARHRFFLNRISAGFALSALQIYLLPLLYGLLGAATYILRQLSIATREMTFTRNAGIHFRLRISLGALAGMSIGWFLSPEESSTLALSPFALSFLVGYNVEILFLLMDKFILSATKIIGDRTDENKPATPPEKKPVLEIAPPQPRAQGVAKTSHEAGLEAANRHQPLPNEIEGNGKP